MFSLYSPTACRILSADSELLLTERHLFTGPRLGRPERIPLQSVAGFRGPLRLTEIDLGMNRGWLRLNNAVVPWREKPAIFRRRRLLE